MIDRRGRAAFRARVEHALRTIAAFETNDAERKFWRPFRVQLEALDRWTKNEGDVPADQIEKITLGYLAITSLGEEPEDVAPKLLELYEELKEIQTNVMEWYGPY